MLLVDAGIALAVPLFQSFFTNHATWSMLTRQYLYSVIYANLIGIPMALLTPSIWGKTATRPAPLRVILRCLNVLSITFVGCLLGGLIMRSIVGPAYDYWSDFRVSFGLSLVLSSVAVAFVSMYESQESKLRRTVMQLKTKELERERALALATQARLVSLESRIHPHFLFNTINSVSALIHEDPLRAERILTQLAELLRFSLDFAPGGLVPLEKELRIVEDYLEIEKARFGQRLRYRIAVPRDTLDCRVPPLSLQTLVENSVKYAVSPRGRGANLLVQVCRQADSLRLEVRDDGPGFASLELPAGHGLSNLQERITALFGENGGLEVMSVAGETVVALAIPEGNLSSLEPAVALLA